MAKHPTVGVEEEFLLVDPATGEPVARNEAVARNAPRGSRAATRADQLPGRDDDRGREHQRELRAELIRLRRVAADAAEAGGRGCSPSACLRPCRTISRSPTTPRYRRIAERFGMIAHEQGISGCHVHVAVPDREPRCR